MFTLKNVVGSIVIGVVLGAGAYGYMYVSKPQITEANSKPHYINSLEDLKEKPIIKEKMFKANDNYANL